MGMAAKTPTHMEGSLEGKLLVATPAIVDSCFARSVIYLCAHNAEGAMGVIINYPIETVQAGEVFSQLGIASNNDSAHMPIYFGGPVEANRGFVVHESAMSTKDGILIDRDGIAVSASMTILKALADSHGISSAILTLGYAGWSAGQLESEIEQGSWFVIPATKELVLEAHNDAKWSMAISTLGIDMGHYSTTVGHA